MLMESLYLSAFIMGLLGSTHCAGMCGGIVSALSIGIDPQQRNQRITLYLLAYNGGRILSYMVAGALIATLGSALSTIGEGMVIRQIFTLLSALLMILLGLYLSGWWPAAILKIERGGAIIWHRIEPIARRWIPIRSSLQAWGAGLLWGWLPCGLVYTALLWSLSAESTLQGALIMGSFGLGTLPALFGLGLFSSQLSNHLQQQWVRATAGIMVASFGIFQIFTLL
ncbi:MAG: sulfite exporter TauE/SafE family protein [Gammaproteobacteria bacterium]|nr:sulfite exporter TauE/SafE family protein [Gammaproteobacteria bacterium]MBT4607796.1 sulfite exporter TauE/SafE family protein [Thiotrichales bacterium]MBT3473645.1 sulfite exporter TauE/SafE family protein [Gammaproteobacteria bacterium]MBT3966282.1 sulfite exporter TauE/SafE family protein [Gammaproteobacteria bacterium]MBT4081701.1 sulfite exporter TauE/SafE family protein [Gammaproteobacteria bacterium]